MVQCNEYWVKVRGSDYLCSIHIQPCHWLTTWPWTCCITSMSINFQMLRREWKGSLSSEFGWLNDCLNHRNRTMRSGWWWGIDRKTPMSLILEVTCIWFGRRLIEAEFHFLTQCNFEPWLNTLLLWWRYLLGREYKLNLRKVSDGGIKLWITCPKCGF